MAKGHVKWFSNPKGYGFVLMEDGSEIFVHHSLILGEGYKTLKEGEEVQFDLIATDKGKQAHNVQRLAMQAKSSESNTVQAGAPKPEMTVKVTR